MKMLCKFNCLWISEVSKHPFVVHNNKHVPLASFSCLVFCLCCCCVSFQKHFPFTLSHYWGISLARVTYLGYLPLLRASGRNNFHSEASLMLIVLNPQRNHLSDLHKTHFYGILIAKKHILEKKYINGHDKSWFICILMVLSPANPVENFLCVL